MMMEIILKILYFTIKLFILFPIAIVLTIINYMFCFAGNIICFLSKIIGGFFVLGGVVTLICEPNISHVAWTVILMGILLGSLTEFLCDFGTEILNGVTHALMDI